MAYCVKCGAQVNDGVKFCPQCGGEIPVTKTQMYPYGGEHNNYYQNNSQSNGQYFDAQDVRQNKAMGVLSYLGILVLIPILARDKNSEYVAFHANQGLVLFIVNIVMDVLTGGGVFSWFSWLYYDFGIIRAMSWAFDIALLVFLIMGIVNACNGVRKELPLIGKIRIIK